MRVRVQLQVKYLLRHKVGRQSCRCVGNLIHGKADGEQRFLLATVWNSLIELGDGHHHVTLVAASTRYLDVELRVHRCCLCVTTRTTAISKHLDTQVVEETRTVSQNVEPNVV